MLDPAVLSHLIPLFTQHVSQDSYHWKKCRAVFLVYGNVVNPQHFDADPDSTHHPDAHLDADPDADLYFMRIRMRLFTLMRIRIRNQILASK
jgi:hypothetical protein